MTKKAGIIDIANLAGVSTATVSRTLRNPELVSKKTREAVMRAVNACNYRPNQMGINLRTKRSGNIVAIIPDITNPFNAGLIKAIEQVAQERGYSVLLGDTQGDEDRIRHYAAMVDSRQADGIILCSQFMPFELDKSGKPLPNLPPLVNVNENSLVDGIHKVMINNQEAARLAVNHLLELGHKNIACITGPSDTNSSKDRLTGYMQAITDADLDVNPNYIQTGNYQLESGIEATQQLLLLKERPTAIFCFNDEMAIGAMSLLKDNGYKVPEDISIIGFDDIRFSQFTSPSLTTIRQPVEQIGRACMNMLIKIMNKESIENNYVEYPVELIQRNSTAAPKSNS